MAAAPSALLLLPPFPVLSTYRLQSRSRPSAPKTDDSRVGGIMRGEKNYYCRGAAGDHGSCPTTTSPLASALLMPSEAVSSSWSESGGGLSGADEEETRLLQLLRTAPDPSEAFQALQAALPRRGGRLGFPRRKEALYRALGRVLVEGGSDEKRLCLQLLSDVLRGQGEAGQLEEAFSLALLPQLVVSLREENPALRKDALQILHICLKRSSGEVLRTLIQQGLESTDARLRASTALLLPILLTTEDLLLGLDLTEVIISLARKLGDQETEEESETAFSALQQIGERLGQDRFQSYISRLPSALRRHYNRRLESQFGSQVPYYLELEAAGFPEDPLPCAVTLSNSNLKFGIIPQELHSRLLDQEDYKNRTQAVEELKQVLGKFNPSSSTPHSSLVGFISLLYNLLDDSNFKVVHGTLQVLHLLVIRLGEQVQQFLGPVIAASVKVLADNKLVIKQEYMKIFLKLMKEVGPQQVLCLLLEHLKHKHSRVREEVVNICICSLLTYPSEDFDLPKLSFDLAPALVDSKRRVRQAALEAFAVLASSMGSGKTSILFKAVDTVELQDNGDGVMNAVQARLARKTLPRLTEQGFVEYAVLMPSSAGGRSNYLAHGADTDWLLAGNRTQSAHCHCGDHVRDSMQIYGSYSPTICTRRVLSAGKGKNKLPWENEQPGIMGENQTSTSKDIEQFSTYDFIPSAKLKPSQGMPVNDDLCFSRKRVSRNLFQNSRDFNPDSLPLCAAGENSREKPPVQLTPALVRSPSCRRGLNGTKPVPPIPRGISLLPDKADLSTVGHKKKEPDDIWKCEKDSLPIDLSELNFKDKDLDQEEMHSSLRSLRNSAAKKRAKLSGSTSDLESPDSAMKLDLTMDSPSLSSSPNISSYSESGVYSQESLTSSLSTTPQGKRIMSDIFPTFGSKPCPTRLSSAKNKISHIAEQSPSAGSSSNPQQISSFDFTTAKTLAEDSVVVVGKGVFGSLSSAPATCSQSVISSVENGDTFSIKQSIEPPSGIYGRSVQQNISSYLDAENEKDTEVSISKSTYNKMRQKRKEEKELFHNKNCEKKEKNTWERMRHTGTEKMASESETSTGAVSQYKERMPSVTHSPEIMDLSELRPFSKPEIALTEALRLLADEDWEKKIEGLNFIRCLAAFHSEILNTKLHETNFAVVQEVKNLRSGVSRAAVVCLSDLFTYLKKSMDQELDTTVKVLLHKAGESNTFIREDVDKALRAMVNNVTPARAVVSLINGGQSHLHIAVRRCTAQHLSDVLEFMEPERILSAAKDMAERILPAAAKFAQDSSQETRYYGRKMLFFMMCHPNFEKMLEKYVPSKDLPYIKDSVRNLQQKGLGEIPLDTPSAKGRRSHTGSVGNTRSSSVSRDAFNSAERAVTEVREVTRKSVPRNSLESAEYLKLITGLLNAKDFRDRINGIKQLLSDTENNQDLVVGNIVKIFDAFKSRLHDSNSKVNLVALETMHKMIPLLRDHLSPIINMLIPAIVDNNLNSKNPGIYAAATNVVQALSQHVDNYLLLQPFCTKAQFLNGKAKQDMTEKLADIVMELYQRKPHATEQKVLVVLWHLLGNMTNSGSLPGAGGNIRTATAKLSKALFAQMGQNLLNQAASQPPHIKKSLEELLDMTILNEL
ncbi:TOG array regulator of axonemal microtubules protein 1 isoform X6 [Pongo abelii]|uniref:TOG array regulator of axonemal microtubules protein 1 isoform X6 n=1 Tax=Pongo abelii TaxID=9601 RepID=UPI0023E8A8EF|nr:TOG array regulator of axonemal microtubules protein 1 isoform X4 [Pongo abelii]